MDSPAPLAPVWDITRHVPFQPPDGWVLENGLDDRSGEFRVPLSYVRRLVFRRRQPPRRFVIFLVQVQSPRRKPQRMANRDHPECGMDSSALLLLSGRQPSPGRLPGT